MCKPRHRVLLCFEWRAGVWQVVYRELNVWPFPRTSRFLDPAKIWELYNRFGVNRDDSALQHGLAMGRGMVELELSPEQFAVLKEPREEV